MFNMLPDDADFTLHTDKLALQFLDHTFYQYLNLLITHLEARMLKDYTTPSMYKVLVVKTDSGAKDKVRMQVLGGHRCCALHMCLNMHLSAKTVGAP